MAINDVETAIIAPPGKPHEPELVFSFTETEPDGGGRLKITAYTPEHKETMCDMFRRDYPKQTKYAPLCGPDPLSVTLEPRDHPQQSYGREAWYAFPIALDDQWLAPYKAKLEKMTGCTVTPMNLAITDPKPLCYTRHRSLLRIEDGHVQCTIYLSAHPWNGKSALEYGHGRAESMLIDEVSYREPVREYIGTANGQYKRNPKYATGYQNPAQPRVVCSWLWSALWNWWEKNHASEAQRQILAAVRKLRQKGVPMEWECAYDRCPYGYSIYYADSAGKCEWNASTRAGVMTWDEFAKLADKPAAEAGTAGGAA